MKARWLLILSTFVAACGGALQYDLHGTELSPGADAKVRATVEPERNLTQLEIEAKNLTPADRVLEGGKTYVVWARTSSRDHWMRLGALDLSEDGRTGTAKLTISETQFDVLVTAEPEADVATPSNKQVFTQRVSKDS